MKNFITILTVLLSLFVSPIIAQNNPGKTPETATPTEASTPAESQNGDDVEESEDALLYLLEVLK